MKSTEMIRLENVSRDYSMGEAIVHALHDVSLSVNKGKFVVVLGPSGSGKTTMLNLVGALDAPTSGKVKVGGRVISELSEGERTRFRAESIGLVFQFYNLFPTLTALENVEFGVALTIKDKKELRRAAQKYLAMVGLKDRMNNFPAQLSGGEQQRVAVARSLAKEPVLLLADEPTGNLDYEAGQVIWELIRRLNKETGTTVLAVTHEDRATEIADVTVRLRSGRIIGVEWIGGRSTVHTGA